MQEALTFELVVAVMGLLFAASLVAVLAAHLRFPFTILLVILGLFLGWATQHLELLHPLKVLTLTPEVVLFVFLPVLIFESAFNLNARALIKNLSPILTLAVPGLLISTAVVGTLVHLLLGLPLDVALLFGALISATDPVAVIALFKEMGAPRRLTLLVEGESLFNDGTALVLFRVLLGIVLAGRFVPSMIWRGLLSFATVFLGGVLVGVLLAFLFAKIIEAVEENPLVEVTLTTILAHSAFLTAEEVFGVSGVMATVAAGLTMGSYGRTKISPAIHAQVKTFWEYFAFIANSLIFLLVGLSIDLGRFFDNAWAILAAALAVLAARALAVYPLFPLLGRLGRLERVGKDFQTVIFWGGLRGALAIVMALSLPADLEEHSLLLVLTLGVVLFTLLVNGLTIRPLMRALGLDRYSLEERYERCQARLVALGRALAELPSFSRQAALQHNVIVSRQTACQEELTALRGQVEELRSGESPLHSGDEFEIHLRHCLMLERREYRRLFEQGHLQEEGLRELSHHIDLELDRLREGHELTTLESEPSLFSRLELGLLRLLGRVFLFAPLVRRFKTRRIARGYQVERARFIAAGRVLEETASQDSRKTTSPEALTRSQVLYQTLRQAASQRMEAIRSEFPEYVEKVEASILERFCLRTEREAFRELHSRGALSEKVLSEMEERIQNRLHRIKAPPVEELLIPPLELMRLVPCFHELDRAELTRLAGRLRAFSFLPGEEIVRQGRPGDSLFILGRGQVEVRRDHQGRTEVVATLKAGDFFGEIALLHPQPRTATVRALTPCTLLELSRARILPLLERAPELKRTLEDTYRRRIRQEHPACDNPSGR